MNVYVNKDFYLNWNGAANFYIIFVNFKLDVHTAAMLFGY